MPEIVACHMVSGEADYLLEVVVPDLERYQRFLLDKLLELPMVREVRSNIAIRSLKASAALPLDHLAPAPPAAARRLRQAPAGPRLRHRRLAGVRLPLAGKPGRGLTRALGGRVEPPPWAAHRAPPQSAWRGPRNLLRPAPRSTGYSAVAQR